MTSLQRSVRQWTVSFLVIDAAFWLWVIGTCLFNNLECADTWAFGSYFYYLPFSTINFPWYASVTTQTGVVVASFLTLVACHAAVGAVIGWLMKDKALSWVKSILISFAIVLIAGFVQGSIATTQEIERETYTQLWSVYEIDESSVTFKVAEWQVDADVNTPFYVEEEGENWQALENTEQTVVKVLCMSDRCKQEEDSYEVMTFDEYLAARRACLDAPIDCAYYSIHVTPDLFDVTYNPTGIVLMQERYLP